MVICPRSQSQMNCYFTRIILLYDIPIRLFAAPSILALIAAGPLGEPGPRAAQITDIVPILEPSGNMLIIRAARPENYAQLLGRGIQHPGHAVRMDVTPRRTRPLWDPVAIPNTDPWRAWTEAAVRVIPLLR
jgi:hypothetical protein